MANLVTPIIDFCISTLILAFSENDTWEQCVCYSVRFPVAYHFLIPCLTLHISLTHNTNIELTRSLVLLREVQNLQAVGFKNALLHFVSFASVLYKEAFAANNTV
jgi:hypothetical protein